MDGHKALAHLKACVETREMAAACLHMLSPEAAKAASLLLAERLASAGKMDFTPHEEEVEVSSDCATVCRLVLQHEAMVGAGHDPDVPATCPATAAATVGGAALLAQVFRGVFCTDMKASLSLPPVLLPVPLPESPAAVRWVPSARRSPVLQELMHHVRNGTVSQSLAASDACLFMLKKTLSPATCLSLMPVAEACGSAQLAKAARKYALSHLPAALQADPAGLASLGVIDLALLLADDKLQVTEERMVVDAIVAWVEAPRGGEEGAARRSRFFGRLLLRCVRWDRLSLSDLQAIDALPLVGKDSEATKLCAGHYIRRIMGLSDVPTSPPRRQVVAAVGAAAAALGAMEIGDSDMEGLLCREGAGVCAMDE